MVRRAEAIATVVERLTEEPAVGHNGREDMSPYIAESALERDGS